MVRAFCFLINVSGVGNRTAAPENCTDVTAEHGTNFEQYGAVK